MFESQRCKFRRIEPGDYAYLRELESNPEVVKYTGMRRPQTLEQTQERLNLALERKPLLEPYGVWLVFSKINESLIGWAMLVNRDLKYTELGYMLVQGAWGQGYATEIAGRIVEYGFKTLKLKGISAATDVPNVASTKVLKKLGFVHTETVVKSDPVLGGEFELQLFELLA